MPSLLFVINAAIVGGAERHTAALASDLLQHGFNATIFAIKAGTIAASGGVSLIEPKQPVGFWRRARQLARLLDEERFEAVIAVNQRPLALIAAARLTAKHRPRVAAIFHTTKLRNAKEEAMQLAYNQLFKKADLVVFVSENQRRHWAERGLRPNKGLTIVNGIDLTSFNPPSAAERLGSRHSLGIADEDYVLGCSAMLRAEKNHLQLIQAVAALRHEGIPARCLLVGDGPMRVRIISTATELGISEHVLSVGLQKDVRRYVAAFDAGVLTSTSVETLSLSALEIMSMGIPMIMSDIGGASEIIEGTGGRTFPSGDTAALLDILRDLANDTRRRELGFASRQKVERQFDVSNMTEMFAHHFGKLCSEPLHAGQ